MKDALDTVKYTLRKFLLDDDNQQDPPVIQAQECSWKKVLSSNTYPAFRQQIGEKLLDLTKKVRKRENAQLESILVSKRGDRSQEVISHVADLLLNTDDLFLVKSRRVIRE